MNMGPSDKYPIPRATLHAVFECFLKANALGSRSLQTPLLKGFGECNPRVI